MIYAELRRLDYVIHYMSSHRTLFSYFRNRNLSKTSDWLYMAQDVTIIKKAIKFYTQNAF